MSQATKVRRNGSPAPAANNGTGANRPVHEIKMGRIVGAIWEHRDSQGQPWYNVTISRIYKGDDGKWARSDSFGKHDLPLVMRVAQLCHDWMYANRNDDSQ